MRPVGVAIETRRDTARGAAVKDALDAVLDESALGLGALVTGQPEVGTAAFQEKRRQLNN